MFSIIRRVKPAGKEITLKIAGMHCTSCAMNIDGALEDLDGVKEARTSYAKSEVTIVFDESKVKQNDLIQAIREAGYTASV